jgi:glycosyltransferase involved in cell wall biosynthesis
VPVVGYAVGGSAQIIEHGVHGLLADVGDRDTLARHLARLLDDEPMRMRMALACWERQHALLSWSDAARACKLALQAEATAR